MFLAVRREVERASRRLAQGPLPLDLASTVGRYRDGVVRLTGSFPRLLVGVSAARLQAEAERLQAAGVPTALAERVALSTWLPAALDVDDLARETGEAVDTVGAVYFVLGDALRLDWLRDRIADLPRGDRWQTEARAALRDELHEAHRALAGSVLRATDPGLAPADRVAQWSAASPLAVARYQQVLADIEAGATHDLTTLAVARRALRELGNPD
jgi:glutamate dehydrogenase